MDSVISDKRDWGATDEEIEEFIESQIVTLDIFHENLVAYQIYRSVGHGIEAGMGGAFYTGLNRTEITSLMKDVYQVPKNERVETLEKIIILETRALTYLNNRS